MPRNIQMAKLAQIVNMLKSSWAQLSHSTKSMVAISKMMKQGNIREEARVMPFQFWTVLKKRRTLTVVHPLTKPDKARYVTV